MKRFEFPLDKVRQWRHGQAEVEELKLQKLHVDLRAVDVEPAEAVMVGDSANDVVAARGAGTWTAGIRSTIGDPQKIGEESARFHTSQHHGADASVLLKGGRSNLPH